MVELLYRDDPYLKACEATVLAARVGSARWSSRAFDRKDGVTAE